MDCCPIAGATGYHLLRTWPTVIERCADSVTGSRRGTFLRELPSHAALTAVQLEAFAVVE